MKISFITPSYNNLEYLKLCHQSLLDNIDDINWEHCIADDGSSDGTLEWLKSLNDNTIKFIRKEKRIGHTELYNELVNNVSTGNIIFIFHADMFLASKNSISNMLKHLKEKTIVSATRVECNGMYPASPEKILIDFGSLTIDGINLSYIKDMVKKSENEGSNKSPIKSIFAPWMCYKKDYLPMDLLYSPYPHEDEDVFLRFRLNEYDIIQPLDACIPHFCSRGHRKTDKNDPTKDNDTYAFYENKARRNYIRKWQSWIQFEEYQRPKIPKIFNVGFSIKNCLNINLLYSLEPWCSSIYIEDDKIIKNYIEKEQPQTAFNLFKRIKNYNSSKNNDIIIDFDASLLNTNNIQYLTQLSNILSDSGELGKMSLDIFNFEIKKLQTYESQLINLNTSYYQNQLIH